MDNLEKFVKENRESLDIYRPGKGIWKRINSGIRGRKILNISPLLKAAMAFLVLGSGFILYEISRENRSSKYNDSGNSAIYSESPQLNETELYYGTLINNLYKKATPILTSNPEIEIELKSDFSRLDSMCAEIKSDLKDNVANQEVVEALILNYRAKIQILEDMLIILGENDSTKNIQSYEL